MVKFHSVSCLLVLCSMKIIFGDASAIKPAYFNIPFEKIMKTAYPIFYITKGKLQNLYGCSEAMRLLEQLYDNFIVQNFYYSAEPLIPKKIHQLWFSGKVDEKYYAWQESWIKNHPDWEYKLWTLQDIEDFGLINKDKFDRATNHALKADIARYEILYMIGGLYVDIDMECLKPFDIFHHCCEFYACCDHRLYFPIEICCMASRPGNAILKKVIDAVSEAEMEILNQEITYATGPGLFSKCFLSTVKQCDDRCVIFPSSFFLTLPADYRFAEANSTHKGVNKWIRPESYAIHYWHSSWSCLSFDKKIEKFRMRIRIDE